ncbi:MAG: hypothetical protein ABSD70_13660 [Terracidiphilus sp.]|jgi:hypothetical protein
MQLFRRFALLLAIALPAIPAVLAQSSSSSSSNPAQDQAQIAYAQSSTSGSGSSPAQQSAAETQGQITVQQRIRQRREQRRAAAIHDNYDHKWETYIDTGYLRFIPGPSAQRLTYYAWETGLARFSSERLGWVADARGYFGTAYVGLNESNITRPAISQYDLMIGPVYRFYEQPRYAISGRVIGGPGYGNFEGDTAAFKNLCNLVPGRTGCLLYPNGISYAASVSIIGELNVSPGIALKLAPEYFFSGFGTFQASRGFTGGIVYRFGKQ